FVYGLFCKRLFWKTVLFEELCFFKKRYEYETNEDKLSVVSCTDSFQKKYRFL
uniref:Uncharacterized protein n=1 Tax=Amphimedon queenslandica TaxID=400682 RepID=A0A1X7UE89_AMPQE